MKIEKIDKSSSSNLPLTLESQHVEMEEVEVAYIDFANTEPSCLLSTKGITTCIAIFFRGLTVDRQVFIAMYHWQGLDARKIVLDEEENIKKVLEAALGNRFNIWWEENSKKEITETEIKNLLEKDEILKNEFKKIVAKRMLVFFIKKVKKMYVEEDFKIEEISFIGGQKQQIELSGTEFEIEGLHSVLSDKDIKKEITQETGVLLPQTYQSEDYPSSGEQRINMYLGIAPLTYELLLQYKIYEAHELSSQENSSGEASNESPTEGEPVKQVSEEKKSKLHPIVFGPDFFKKPKHDSQEKDKEHGDVPVALFSKNTQKK